MIKRKLAVLFTFLMVFFAFSQTDQKERDKQLRKSTLQYYKDEIFQNNPRAKIFANNFDGNEFQNINYDSIDYNLAAEKSELSQQTNDSETFNPTDIKYKRSSLYTFMIADTLNDYYYHIKYVFGNRILSEKFNDHNIGPYQIPGKMGALDQAKNIEGYLNKNQMAKHMVAKWFNRGRDGSFNMSLIGQRGQYSASDLDIKIALQTERGKAMLKDAGEELIDHTFIVVYDFETIDNWRPSLSNTIKSNIIVRAYLYRLVWDEETATVFYNDYWMDKNSLDPSRKAAFDRSDIFKLKYIGSVVTQEEKNITLRESVEHSMKISEKGYIDPDELGYDQDALTINNALNVCLNDLQIKYLDLRTKFPLYSGNPISAKVGKKEGLKHGDEFEVLERIQIEDRIEYLRVGIIKVNKEDNIWDNTTEGDWFEEDKLEYTIFAGKKRKYQSGMFIRQIN